MARAPHRSFGVHASSLCSTIRLGTGDDGSNRGSRVTRGRSSWNRTRNIPDEYDIGLQIMSKPYPSIRIPNRICRSDGTAPRGRKVAEAQAANGKSCVLLE